VAKIVKIDEIDNSSDPTPFDFEIASGPADPSESDRRFLQPIVVMVLVASLAAAAGLFRFEQILLFVGGLSLFGGGVVQWARGRAGPDRPVVSEILDWAADFFGAALVAWVAILALFLFVVVAGVIFFFLIQPIWTWLRA
jgi:hypothetical protein